MMTILLICALLVIVCVGIHYRCLTWFSRSRWSSQRWWINVLVLGALTTHIVEMSLFAFAYYLLCGESFGNIREVTGNVSQDYFYFSFVVYTSLGFGDLVPHGLVRILTAFETLTGVVLVSWTASFLFVEMQNWAKLEHSARDEH